MAELSEKVASVFSYYCSVRNTEYKKGEEKKKDKNCTYPHGYVVLSWSRCCWRIDNKDTQKMLIVVQDKVSLS